MSQSAKHSRQQSAGMIDPTTNPVAPASTGNMSMPIVQDSRCHCHKPHRGHESMTAQMNSMRLGEAASNGSIAASPRTSPSTPSGSIPLSHIPPATRQDRRKEQVGLEIQDHKEELCIHCFFSSFFPGFDEDAHREKINSLSLLAEGRFKLTSPSPKDPSTRVTWPSSSLENAFYLPLTELLNEIVDHVNGTPNLNHSKNVQFVSYNRPMAPITPESLKPDLLLVETTASKLAHCQWEHPITSVEVKSSFWEALKQLGIYACEMTAARPGRQFCWGICLDHTEAAFRLVLFTPDSVHYTQPFVITRETGYREMVKAIIALLSQSDLLTVGEDLSRDSTTKVLPNGDKLHIEAVEFDRKSIIGRKTRVLSAVVIEKSETDITPTRSLYAKPVAPSVRKSGRTKTAFSLNRRACTTSIQTQAPTRPYSAAVSPSPSRQLPSGSVVNSPSPDQDTGARREADTLSSDQLMSQESPSDLALGYCLKNIRANLDEQITFAESPDHLKLGDFLVIKESWPLVSRQDIEWEALRSCSRQFGVPEVVYRVTGKHPMPVVCTRKPRVPQQIALREKGHRLQEAGSPRILLTAVLHAIIGHWNLFQKGWLHRDVSIGNVLILVDPVTKSPPTGLKGLDELTKCQGMLIDGDAMIHFSSDREPGGRRSCTLPFLSRRLLNAWSFGVETFDQYFDDLESFAWVLLWALLEIAEENDRATAYDRARMKRLNANDLEVLEGGKDSIFRQLEDLSEFVGLPKSQPTSLLDPFIEILHHWFVLTRGKRECGKTETLSANEESAAFYDAFITFAMEKMSDLPETWEQSDNSHQPFLP